MTQSGWLKKRLGGCGKFNSFPMLWCEWQSALDVEPLTDDISAMNEPWLLYSIEIAGIEYPLGQDLLFEALKKKVLELR